jgi:hypothetical protein
MKDLFGNPDGGPRKKGTPPKGYAAPPGTGPSGETCGSCAYIRHSGNAGRYKKCELQRFRWTHGPGSDIRSGSPACSRWEKKGGVK